MKEELINLNVSDRENRIVEITKAVRSVHEVEYLNEKKEQRLKNQKEQKTRESRRKTDIGVFNREFQTLQSLLEKEGQQPWLKNLCSEVSGSFLC